MRSKIISSFLFSLSLAMLFVVSPLIVDSKAMAESDSYGPTYSETRTNPNDKRFTEEERMTRPYPGSGTYPNDLSQDFSFLRVMLTHWGKCSLLPNSTSPQLDQTLIQKYCVGDLNQDDVVDIRDLEQVVASWNIESNKQVGREIVAACQNVSSTEEQRTCLIRAFQDKEVAVKARKAASTWERTTEQDISGSETGGSQGQGVETIEHRVINYFQFMGNMITRMHAAVLRLEVLSQRIDSRIAKLEEAGQNMDEQKQILVDAGQKLEMAKEKISSVSETYEDKAEITNPKEYFGTIKEDVSHVKELLKSVHQSLVDVIQSIKVGTESDEEREPAPATPEVVN